MRLDFPVQVLRNAASQGRGRCESGQETHMNATAASIRRNCRAGSRLARRHRCPYSWRGCCRSWALPRGPRREPRHRRSRTGASVLRRPSGAARRYDLWAGRNGAKGRAISPAGVHRHGLHGLQRADRRDRRPRPRSPRGDPPGGRCMTGTQRKPLLERVVARSHADPALAEAVFAALLHSTQ